VRREFDLGTRRFLCLLGECADHDDPTADCRDVKRPGNSIAASQPQLPQLPLQVLHMRFAQAFQPDCRNALGKPDKPRRMSAAPENFDLWGAAPDKEFAGRNPPALSS